jgi:hypothetical protein
MLSQKLMGWLSKNPSRYPIIRIVLLPLINDETRTDSEFFQIRCGFFYSLSALVACGDLTVL